MRLFAAVEIPDALRERLATATADLLVDLRTARRVGAENLHVTVRFFGEVEESGVDAVGAAMQEAASAVVAVTAEARGFCAFPSVHRPRILWAGLADPARAVLRLESEVTRRVGPLGIPNEDHPFTPHVTVARLRDERGWSNRRKRAGALRLDDESPSFGALPIERLTLFQSELTPDGPRYTALARFPLQPTSHKERQ
jgi:2'-5' RNA ligase